MIKIILFLATASLLLGFHLQSKSTTAQQPIHPILQNRFHQTVKEHIAYACTARWMEYQQLPLQTRDGLGARVNKAALCSCIDQVASKHKQIKGNLQLYDLARRYQFYDLDLNTQSSLHQLDMAMATISQKCWSDMFN